LRQIEVGDPDMLACLGAWRDFPAIKKALGGDAP
jgi:hypothetical protein